MQKQGRGRIVNIASIAGLDAGRLVDRLCGVEGRAHSPDALHGGRARAATCWSIASRPACSKARAPPRTCPTRRSSSPPAAALLKSAADKDDVADQVVTMCRTETMTGPDRRDRLRPLFPLKLRIAIAANGGVRHATCLTIRHAHRRRIEFPARSAQDRRHKSQACRTPSARRRHRPPDLCARARRDEARRVSGRGLRRGGQGAARRSGGRRRGHPRSEAHPERARTIPRS